MTNRKNRFKRALCFMLALVLLLTTCASALTPAARQRADSYAGTFHYVLGDEFDLSDTYIFSDRWFDGDAAVENEHLRTISLIAAMASGASNEHADPEKSAGIVSLLTGLGFSDVQVNTYYTITPGTDSAGCCIARKQLGEYTLLAIIPRSQGYAAEWAGNFNVGEGGLHRGFKAARDEVLRFAKQYVTSHGIDGKLKVWVAGHSRGAAIANLTAGFLVDYPAWLGDLDAHRIYAYTFGTPAGVFSGLTAADVATVAAAPEANATPGAACTLPGDGAAALDLSDAKYDCIRNYYTDADFTPMLMPAVWGATRYGRDTQINVAWAASGDLAARYTAELDPRIREESLFGDPAVGFAPKMISTEGGFALVDDPTSEVGVRDFVAGRVAMLTAAVPTREAYVAQGYEAALRPLFAAIFGGAGLDATLDSLLSDPDSAADAIFAALSIYFTAAYAKAERLDAAAGATTNIDSVKALCTTLSLALAFAPDLLREKLAGLVGESETAAAILNSALAKAPAFFADANILNLSAGDSYADAMLDVAAGYVQPVLAQLAPETDTAAARNAAQLLSNLFFGNDGDTFALPLTITLTLYPALSAEVTINLATDELKTAATLLGNIAPMGREHINAAELGWLRANDSAYVLGEFVEAADGSARLLLTGKPGADLRYTVNSVAPCAFNAVYRPEGILNLCRGDTVCVSACEGGVMNPAWRLVCPVGPEPAPIHVVSAAQQPGTGFADVPVGAYYEEAVKWATANGVTYGVSETSFAPYGFCTRAQIVTFLWRAAGCPAVAEASAFADVAPGAYYEEAVKWAAANGIACGTTETTFSPEEHCTCAQILAFVWRAAGRPEPKTPPTSDAYYAAAAAWAFESGAAKDAYDQRTFAPDADCFRADALTLIYRTRREN